MPRKTKPAGFPSTYAVVTLGCRANQYDGAAMAADLSSVGLRSTSPERADVVVVNTCMVTQATETQCRKLVNRVRRSNSNARLVVAGCMSGGNAALVRSWDGVELEFSRDALEAIAELALARGTGARALRAIIEEVMLDIMYEVPSLCGTGKCLVTSEAVRRQQAPRLIGSPEREAPSQDVTPAAEAHERRAS